ncbi:hypothetical protein ACKKBG_A08600 [Auxenochlorella protothecoides x Auxenochlorella symbiontica]
MSVTAEDVDTLSYAELQRKCKDLGFSARGKRDELTRRLLGLSQTSQASGGSSPSSSTPHPSTATVPSRLAQNATTATPSHSVRTATTPSRRRGPALGALADALSTPLPAPRAAASASDTPPPPRPAPSRSVSLPFKILVGLAVLGLLGGLALPYAAQHDLAPRAAAWAQRGYRAASAGAERAGLQARAVLRDGAGEVRAQAAALADGARRARDHAARRVGAARDAIQRRRADLHVADSLSRGVARGKAELAAALARARVAVRAVVDKVHTWAHEAVRRARGAVPSSPAKAVSGPAAAPAAGGPAPKAGAPCPADPAFLQTLVPPGEQWRAQLDAASDVLDGEKVHHAKTQATVLLLAYGGEEQRSASFPQLATVGPKGCVRNIDAWMFAEPGLLQRRLANDLTAQPSTIFHVHRVEMLPPASVPVLVNALSEGGGFEYSGTVSASQATFILNMVVPRDWLAAVDGDAFATGVKDALSLTLSTHPNVTDREAAAAAAAALRRRIDVVLPAGTPPPPTSEVLLGGDGSAALTQEELNAPIDLDAMLAEDPELMAKFLEGLDAADDVEDEDEDDDDEAASESVDDDLYDDAEEEVATPGADAEDPFAGLGTEDLDLPHVDL